MRMLTRALAFFFLLAAAGVSAQTADPVYDILFDLDRNAATGCAASPTGTPAFGGYERRLRATLDPTTLTVDTVEVETCDGSVFQPLMPLTGGQPAGLNNGIDGTDVIEVAVTTDALNLGNATLIDLAFAADSGAGSDILDTQTGAPGGPPILLGLPVSIPTLSVFALLLLAALVVAVAWRAHRRAGQLSAVGMVMLVAAVAWAMNFAADGDVSDWAGFSPAASDPDGDSTDGNSGIDLRAAFYAVDNNALFFRIDLTDIENQAPIAIDDAYATDEDTALSVAAPGVLDNDSDADGDPISAILQTGPANAQSFVLNTDGSFDYTPNADFNGADSFTYLANDGQADSGIATVTLTINPINDPPVINDDTASTLEDDPVIIAVLDNDSDVDGALAPGSVSISTPPANGTAVPNPATGEITYTKTGDFNGMDSFIYEVCDDGTPLPAECGTATVNVEVRPVNDAPSFTPGADPTVLEDAGAQTIAGWATNLSAGPPDEAGQVLTFNIIANDNPTLFDAGPAIDESTGDLSFTAAADANGTANITITLSDDGGTADGGVDTSAPVNVSINVTAVNDAPSFTIGADQSVFEDSGQSAVSGFLTDLQTGPPDEAGQALIINVTNDNNGLFGVQPAIDEFGLLTFTPAADAFGTATVTVTVSDDGGTANGGVDTAPPAQFTITVLPINDPPSFVAGGNQAVDEDSGAQTVAAWATAIDDGEGGSQVLAFTITGNTAPALFSAGPTVDPVTGDLTYTPAANAYGSSTITLTLSDDGGTANGGVDSSAPQSFDITINPINDPPTAPATASFTATTNIRIDVPAGSGLLAGASDEATEAADPAGPGMPGTNLSVGNAMNPAPTTTTNGGDLTINADGSFSYNPPAGFTGSDSFSYVVCDDGIGAPGPQCSAAVNVTLTVSGPTVWFIDNSVSGGGNDGRLATPFESLAAYNASMLPGVGDSIFVATGSGAYSDAPLAIALADNQILFGQGTTGTTFDAFTGITAAPNSIARPTLSGIPPLLESAGAGIEVSTSAMASNTIRGLAVGDTTGGPGVIGNGFRGTLNISEVNMIRAGSLLVIDGGTTGIVNASFGTLSSNVSSTGAAFEVTNMAGGSVTAASTTITNPIQDGIRIRQTPMMQFNFGNMSTLVTTSGAGIVTENPGTVTISPPSPITIQTVGGPALDLNGGTYTGFNFGSLSSNNASTGIRLANTAGFISCGGGTIQNTSGDAVVIDGGSNNITLGTFITNAVGRSVSVTNHTGGNVVFNRITDTGSGVFLDNNPGTSFFFTGTMDLNTGVNDAFVATGGGSLDATGPGNTILTSTGTAVRLDGVDIRNTDFTLQSISSSGAASAIVLNMTGGTGDFVVTGDGSTPGSGGTIQGASGNAIALTDTGNVDLRYMLIQSNAANGVAGTNVTNFRLEGVTLFGNGDAVNEGALRFNNLLGTASIVDSTLTGSAEHNIEITNTMGTLSPLTISNSIIGANSAALGADGLLLETSMSAVADVVVMGSTFDDNRSDGIQISANNDSVASLTVDGTVFTTMLNGSPAGSVGARGIVLGTASNADLTFDIGSAMPNTFENFSPNIGEEAINLVMISSSTPSGLMSGRINNNTFTNSGGAVGVDVRGNGALVMEIVGNTGTTTRQAVDMIIGDAVGDAATADVTITNNQLTALGSVPNPTNAAIDILGLESTLNCLNIRDNSATGSGGLADILVDDFTAVAGAVRLESGPTDCGGACVNSDAHLQSTNTITNSISTATLVAPGTCMTP